MRRLALAASVLVLTGLGAALVLGCGSGGEGGATDTREAGPPTALKQPDAERTIRSPSKEAVQTEHGGGIPAVAGKDRARGGGGNPAPAPGQGRRGVAAPKDHSGCPSRDVKSCAALNKALADPAPTSRPPRECPRSLPQEACERAGEPGTSSSGGPPVGPGECPPALSAEQCEDLRMAWEKAHPGNGTTQGPEN